MINAKVLLISDDLEIGSIWSHGLAQRGLETALVGPDQEIIDTPLLETSDLIIIDVHTSQLDGIGLTRRLRTETSLPILLLMPGQDEESALEAYKAGVDEYINKPISPRLFLSKVTAWLRHSWMMPVKAVEGLRVDGVRLNPTQRHFVTTAGREIRLTNLEFRLLHLLMMNPGRVMESALLVDRVWGFTGEGDSALLKNLIYRLRRKIEPDPACPHYVHSIAGEGYMFNPLES